VNLDDAGAVDLTRAPRRIVAIALTALFVIAAADAARPPQRQVLGRAATGAVHVYQRTLSPLLPRIGISCRFVPTCSHYAEASLAKYGVVRGSWRSLKRIARCNPMTPMGTRDDP
jgi:putative membrane protein insertion efficiency factor